MEWEWRDFADFSARQLYEVLRFRQAIFVVEQRSPYADLDGFDDGAHHLLLRIGGELGGYLRLIPFEAKQCVRIGRVSVSAVLRGRGLARALMETALARCKSTYPGWPIALSAQLYLAAFYEELGFRRVSGPYDDGGVPHVEMAMTAESGFAVGARAQSAE